MIPKKKKICFFYDLQVKYVKFLWDFLNKILGIQKNFVKKCLKMVWKRRVLIFMNIIVVFFAWNKISLWCLGINFCIC